jgi:hypothetical protein
LLTSSLAVLDKVQAIYQGRPARLRDVDTNVPIEFLDEYDELEPYDEAGDSMTPSDDVGQPICSVSTFRHLCKLSLIADRILCKLYTEKGSQRNPKDTFRIARTLHAELDRWRTSLPECLAISFDKSGNPSSSCSVTLPHTLCLM